MKIRVTLVARKAGALLSLQQLDTALGKAMTQNIVIDERVPEIDRLHPR